MSNYLNTLFSLWRCHTFLHLLVCTVPWIGHSGCEHVLTQLPCLPMMQQAVLPWSPPPPQPLKAAGVPAIRAGRGWRALAGMGCEGLGAGVRVGSGPRGRGGRILLRGQNIMSHGVATYEMPDPDFHIYMVVKTVLKCTDHIVLARKSYS